MINLRPEVDYAISQLPMTLRPYVEELGVLQRMAIAMVYIYGWTEEQLASELGVSRQAVNKQCLKGIENLRKKFLKNSVARVKLPVDYRQRREVETNITKRLSNSLR